MNHWATAAATTGQDYIPYPLPSLLQPLLNVPARQSHRRVGQVPGPVPPMYPHNPPALQERSRTHPPIPASAVFRLLHLLSPGRSERLFRMVLDEASGSYGWPGYTGMERFPSVTFISQGGFNAVWLVTMEPGNQYGVPVHLVLRLPLRKSGDGTGIRHSVLNEVATLRYIKKHVPSIPVPEVYAFDAGDKLIGVPFIAMEYLRGTTLKDAWPRYTREEREHVCWNIASVVMAMAFTQFEQIGGIQLGGDGAIGPAIEYSRVFGRRKQLFLNRCYDIGPYKTIKDYVVAGYDKELAYYRSISSPSTNSVPSKRISNNLFVGTLSRARNGFIASEKANSIEPFVLVHGDMHSGNILMNGTAITGVLDWEFAGSYPLSDLLRRGFGGLNTPWEWRVRQMVLGMVGDWRKKMLDSVEPAWTKVRGPTFPLPETGGIGVARTV